MELNTQNISTMAVFLYMVISPILAQFGYEIQQEAFTAIVVAVFGLIIAVWSARNPNNIVALGNGSDDDDSTA